MTGPAPGSSPRGGASIISRSSLAEAMAEPCRVLIRSAPAIEVERPRAMSCGHVAAADRQAVDVDQRCRRRTPPPRSSRRPCRCRCSRGPSRRPPARPAPRRTARRPRRANCRWARSTQWPRVWNTASSMETTSRSRPSRRPNMRARIAHAALAVHRPGDRPQVDRSAAGQRTGRAPAAMARDRSASLIGRAPSETSAADAAAGELAAGGGDGDAGDADAGHRLGALDRLGDGVGRLVHVDDRAAAHAARLDVADAGRRAGCGRPAHAVRLHDEAGDLRGAQVDRGGHRTRAAAPRRALQPVRAPRRSCDRDIRKSR